MSRTSLEEPSGSWDSIHVFETSERGRQAHYKLTSTIMLQLSSQGGRDAEMEDSAAGIVRETKDVGDGWTREGEFSLSGSMTRQVRFCSMNNLCSSIARPRLDRTRLATARSIFAYHKYWKDDRGDGNQDEKSFARGKVWK